MPNVCNSHRPVERKPRLAHRFRPPYVVSERDARAPSELGTAKLLGITEDTLQNWAQRRHKPAGPNKVLLKLAAKHPKTVLETAA